MQKKDNWLYQEIKILTLYFKGGINLDELNKKCNCEKCICKMCHKNYYNYNTVNNDCYDCYDCKGTDNVSQCSMSED